MIRDSLELGKAAFGLFSPYRNPNYLPVLCAGVATVAGSVDIAFQPAAQISWLVLCFFALRCGICALQRPQPITDEDFSSGRLICLIIAVLSMGGIHVSYFLDRPPQSSAIHSGYEYLSIQMQQAAILFAGLHYLPWIGEFAERRFRFADLFLSTTAVMGIVSLQFYLPHRFPKFEINSTVIDYTSRLGLALAAWGSALTILGFFLHFYDRWKGASAKQTTPPDGDTNNQSKA